MTIGSALPGGTKLTSSTLCRARRAGLALAAIASLALPAGSIAATPVPEPPSVVAKPDPTTGLVALPNPGPGDIAAFPICCMPD